MTAADAGAEDDDMPRIGALESVPSAVPAALHIVGPTFFLPLERARREVCGAIVSEAAGQISDEFAQEISRLSRDEPVH